MEADWAAEIGPRLDRIDADWPGYIDLRSQPDALSSIPEAAEGSALRETLTTLNGPESPVYTCKCDVWPLSTEELDPFEFDFAASEKPVGMAAYIDVVARDSSLFGSFERHESWARSTALQLRTIPVASGRADLVIRAAMVGNAAGFGLTVYAAGCGADAAAAQTAWEAILRATIAVTMKEAQQLAGE